jgi:hypothetical protein
MVHDVSALGDAVLGPISYLTLRRHFGAILIDAAILRGWICNFGQRPASSRLAHLIQIYLDCRDRAFPGHYGSLP